MPNTVTKFEWFRRRCPGKTKTGGTQWVRWRPKPRTLSRPDATLCGWDDIKIQELTLSLVLRRQCAVETTVKSKNCLSLTLVLMWPLRLRWWYNPRTNSLSLSRSEVTMRLRREFKIQELSISLILRWPYAVGGMLKSKNQPIFWWVTAIVILIVKIPSR